MILQKLIVIIFLSGIKDARMLVDKKMDLNLDKLFNIKKIN